MNENSLPAGFMDHLQFGDDVPEDQLPPLLPPGYPVVFTTEEG